MPITVAPFVLKDITVTLKVGVGTATEYRCQLNRAELVPAASGGGTQTYDTFCDTFTSGSASTAWTLELAGFQAYADVTDLSNFLFDNEGEIAEYVLTPLGGAVSASNPAFTGEVTLAPTNIGGTANQYATLTVSLPCSGKPTKDITA